MKRLWQKITGPSAEETAASGPPAATAAPTTSTCDDGGAAAAGSHSRHDSVHAADGAAVTPAVAVATPALTAPIQARAIEPEEDEDIESELSRFESRCVPAVGASPPTLLHSLECMLREELLAAAATAHTHTTDSDTTCNTHARTDSHPRHDSDTSSLPPPFAALASASTPRSAVLRLLLTRVRRSVMTRVSLGAMNLLGELMATFRDQIVASSSGGLADDEDIAVQSVVWDLFRLLAPHTSNTHALHCAFNLFEAPLWSARIVTALRRLASADTSLPFVLFDPPSSIASSLLHVPSVSTAKWTSAHQFTSLTWMRFDFKRRRMRTRPLHKAHSSSSSRASSASPPPMSDLTEYAHPPFHLLFLESADGKSSLDLSYSPVTNSFTLRTGPKSCVTFLLAHPLALSRWHHVALVHSKALLGASTATLYLDGRLVGTQKAHYPNKPSSATNVAARVGLIQLTPPTADETPLPPPPPTAALQWRVASTALLDDSINESTARAVYELGPRVSGVAAGATLSTAKCAISDVASGAYTDSNALNDALDDVALVVGRTISVQHRASMSADTERRSMPPSAPSSPVFAEEDDESDDDHLGGSGRLFCSGAEAASMLPTAALPAERLLFFFSARNSVDREAHDFHHAHTLEIQHRRSRSSSAAPPPPPSATTAPAPPTPTPASILINGGLLGAKEGASDALVGTGSGGSGARAHLVKPRALADALRSIGGISRLLDLISKICIGSSVDAQSLALREALLLLAACLRRNPKNLREMGAARGYTLLAHLMQRLGESCAAARGPSPSRAGTPDRPGRAARVRPASQAALILADTSIVELLFSLAGLSDKGNSGSIACASAMRALLLNFHIWSNFDLVVQTYVFEGLVNSIATNPARDENMAAMRQLQLVPWLLTLVADQKLPPPILVHAVSLLREFLMDPPSSTIAAGADQELQLVANFALTACMLHSQHEIHHQKQQQQQQQQQQAQQQHLHSSATAAATKSSESHHDAEVAAMTHTLPVPPAPGRSTFNPSVRRFTMTPQDARALMQAQSSAAAASVNVADGLSALGVATGYLPAASAPTGNAADAFERELGAYRLASFLSARVRRTFLELLLDVLSKLAASHAPSTEHRAAIDVFFKYVDFAWIFSVLYTVDQAIAHRIKRKQMRAAAGVDNGGTTTPVTPRRGSGDGTTGDFAAAAAVRDAPVSFAASARISVDDDEEMACDRACALLSLKILLTYLSYPHLLKRFTAVHGFASLGQLLRPFAHLGEVYAIVLCMVLGKGVYDVPTLPSSTRSLASPPQGSPAHADEWWANMLSGPNATSTRSSFAASNSPAHSTSSPIIALPEAVPLLMALLEEAMQLLAEEHRRRVQVVLQHSATAAETVVTTAVSIAPLLAGATFSAATAAPPVNARRASLIAGISGAALSSAAAASTSHHRHTSISLQPMLAAAMATASRPGRSSKDGNNDVIIPEDLNNLSRQSSVNASTTDAAAATAHTGLDPSFWTQSSRASVSGPRRRTPRVGMRDDVRMAAGQLPDEVTLQAILGFLSRLLTISDDFRTLASKEPFVRMLATVAYAAAPLQPDVAATDPAPLPNWTCVDPASYVAFPPTPLQVDDADAPCVNQLIIAPVGYLSSTAALSSASQNGAAARRAGRQSQTRPPTPADLVSHTEHHARSHSASSSRSTTPVVTPMTAVTLTEHEWSTLQRVGIQEENRTSDAPTTQVPTQSSSTHLAVGIGSPPKIDIFRHPLATSLFHLLRQIALNALMHGQKGTLLLDEMMDQSPPTAADVAPTPAGKEKEKEKHASPLMDVQASVPLTNAAALRSRFQSILLCSVLYRLVHTLSAGEFLMSPKLMANLVARAKHLVSHRLHGGALQLGAGLWLELVLSLLDSTEGRTVMEVECADPLTSAVPAAKRRSSMTIGNTFAVNFSQPLAKPLIDSCNHVVMHLYQHFTAQLGDLLVPITTDTRVGSTIATIVGSTTTSEALTAVAAGVTSTQLHALHQLSRLNQFLLAHHRTLLAEFQQDLVFIATVSLQLFQLITPTSMSPTTGASDRSPAHLIQSLSVSSMRLWGCLLRNKLGYMSELLRLAHHQTVHVATGVIHVDEAANASLSASSMDIEVAGLLSDGPLSPPRSPGTMVDLLDGGFDLLLGISIGDTAARTTCTDLSEHDGTSVAEFLAWRSEAGQKIALVLSKTCGRISAHHFSESQRLAAANTTSSAASLLTEVTKHAAALSALAHRLAPLELALLGKLQRTCSDELQRNLRKQQRERVDQTRSDREFFDDQAAQWIRTAMIYSKVDYSRIGTDEPTTTRDDSTGDDGGSDGVKPIAPSLLEFHEFPLSSSLVLRQPWRLDRIEGPSRVRKRLEQMRVQPKEQPVFNYPYRPFENHRQPTRSQDTTAAESEKGVETNSPEDEVDAASDGGSAEPKSGDDSLQSSLEVPADDMNSESVTPTRLVVDTADDATDSMMLPPKTWTRAQSLATPSAPGADQLLAVLGPVPSQRPSSGHRSTRSDVSSLFTTPMRARRGMGGMGIVAASPHTSMLGRLAAGDARSKRLVHIAGALFTPRVRSRAPSLFSTPSTVLSPPLAAMSPHGNNTTPPPPESALNRLIMQQRNSISDASSVGIVLLSPMSPSPRGSDDLGQTSAFGWPQTDDAPVSVADEKYLTSSPLDEGAEGAEEDIDAADAIPDDTPQSSTEEEWSHPLDARLWWMEEERLSLLLAGETVRFHFNCLRIDGLDERRGILLLCNRAMFVIDQYEVSPDGDIAPVHAIDRAERSELPVELSSAYDTSDASLPLEHRSEKFLYADLVDLQKRRYLLREAGIEIFMQSGYTTLLVLNVAQRDTIYSSILAASPLVLHQQTALSKILAAGASAVASSSSATASTSASASFLHASVPVSKQHSAEFTELVRTTLHPLTKLWQNGSLSNLDYLLSLNAVSGRTFQDLTQYPVMPWVLCDYASEHLDLDDHSSYRDLSKPMGALDEARAATFRQRYRDSDSIYITVDGGDPRPCPRFHHGAHYSSAAGVLYYMIRAEPYTQTLIEFQSGRFDRPDRLFYSVGHSYASASKLSTSDVKELIPEFFYLPEFLQNGNKLNLGSRQDTTACQTPISDVILPRWSHGSAREFIRLHRQALESEFVSAHLHLWIDLIFGCRQQGEAAVNALNVFYFLTYAGQVDIDSIADPILRRATTEQIRSWGQTPLSLFSKPHPPKHLMREVGSVYLKAHLLRPTTSLHVAHPVGVLWADPQQERFFLLRPGHALAPAEGVSAVVGFASSAVRERRKRGPKAAFVAWGFMDGTLRLGEAATVPILNVSTPPGAPHASSATKHARVLLNMHDGIVRVAAFPEIDVGLLVTGGADCNVQVWKRGDAASTPGDADYTLLATLHGHRGAITALAVSKAFSLIASASLDGNVILWDLHGHSPVRYVRVLPAGSRIQAVALNNRSGYLVIASNHPTMLTVCDLNGELLAQYPSAAGDDGTISESLDGISCLHMVDSVGYQMPHSAILFLTGHVGGAIRVWNMNYVMPQQVAQPRGFASPLPPQPTRGSTNASPATTPTAKLVRPTASLGAGHRRPASYLSTMLEEADDAAATEDGIFVPPPTALFAAATSSAPSSAVHSEAEDDEPVWDIEDAAEAAEQIREEQRQAALQDGTLPSFRKVRSMPVSSRPAPTNSRSVSAGGVPALTTAASEPTSARSLPSTPIAPPSPSCESNDSGGRSWRLLVAAELVGHVVPVTALFVPSDRGSVWSGDALGNAMHWTVPVESATNTSGPAHRAGPITGPHALSPPQTSGVGASATACNCKQSLAHKSSSVAYDCRLCSQCTKWVCAYCRLDHLRRDHPVGEREAARQQKTAADAATAATNDLTERDTVEAASI